MIRIEIEPVWRFTRDGDGQSMRVLLDFLHEIRATGKITRAAERAAVSYRHAWNLIEKWSLFFEAALVERHQGRGTTLTPFGERLVWAGQRLQARLGPQLQNLAQELQSELNGLLPQSQSVVRIHASHGFAVSKLRELLARDPGLRVDIRYVGNPTALVSLAHDGCDLAGMHLPQGSLRRQAVTACRSLLSHSGYRIVGFVTREMGLMVKRGNPLGITSLERLLDPAVRFVNRDPDSGTRMLFEQLLAQQRLEGARINGYEHVEFTHAAVAAYVASGMADTCFGVEAAARQFELDFVRLITEDYFFVCRKPALEDDSVKRVLAVMRSREFHEALLSIPGYRANRPGEIRTVRDVLRNPTQPAGDAGV